MSDSILVNTKKALGIDASYTAFDPDILMHINSVFGILNDIGLGPVEGFMIQDDTALWDDYLEGDFNLNRIKTYMYLRVRMLFDPPQTSYLINALEAQYRELEWRLSVGREIAEWAAPVQSIEE